MASEEDEVKSTFYTKEGQYCLERGLDLCRPDGHPFVTLNNWPVNLSFVTINSKKTGPETFVTFNVESQLLLHRYTGISTERPDLQRPTFRRTWKGCAPLSHDFNLLTRNSYSVDLAVGFTSGVVLCLDPFKNQPQLHFNDAQQADRTTVSVVKWVPGTENLLLAGHFSGCLYLYNRDLPNSSHPHYSLVYQGQTYSVSSNKSKGKNPVQRWTVGHTSGIGQRDGDTLRRHSNSSTASYTSAGSSPPDGHSINDLAFSPDCKHFAVASQDGHMRVFDFERQRLVCSMRSYFGGMTCVCWSPDGRYIVTGSEDDLVAVYSFHQRRLVARGRAHCSYVAAVAFDPYNTSPDCLSPPNRCVPEVSVTGEAGEEGQQTHTDANSLAVDSRSCVSGVSSVANSTDAISTTTAKPSANETAASPSSSCADVNSASAEGAATSSSASASADTSSAALKLQTTTAGSTAASTMVPELDNAEVCTSTGKLSNGDSNIFYRFGSVGQDGRLTLWDLGGDILGSDSSSVPLACQPTQRCVSTSPHTHPRLASASSQGESTSAAVGGTASQRDAGDQAATGDGQTGADSDSLSAAAARNDTSGGGSVSSGRPGSSLDRPIPSSSTASTPVPPAPASLVPNSSSGGGGAGGGGGSSSGGGSQSMWKRASHIVRRGHKNRNRAGGGLKAAGGNLDEPVEQPPVYSMDDIPVMPALMCKRISPERLSSIVFRSDCIIISSQDGFVHYWSRPHVQVNGDGRHSTSSHNATAAAVASSDRAAQPAQQHSSGRDNSTLPRTVQKAPAVSSV
eukprot:scpid64576/ scgid7030/ WD repeat-containing protein 20; Protein DMR